MGDVNNDGNPDVVLGWNQVDVVYDDEGGIFGFTSRTMSTCSWATGAGGLAFSSSIGPFNATQNSSGYSSSLVLGDFERRP